MPLPLSLLQAPASPNWSGVYQAVLCLMAVGGLGFLYLTRDRKS